MDPESLRKRRRVLLQQPVDGPMQPTNGAATSSRAQVDVIQLSDSEDEREAAPPTPSSFRLSGPSSSSVIEACGQGAKAGFEEERREEAETDRVKRERWSEAVRMRTKEWVEVQRLQREKEEVAKLEKQQEQSEWNVRETNIAVEKKRKLIDEMNREKAQGHDKEEELEEKRDEAYNRYQEALMDWGNHRKSLVAIRAENEHRDTAIATEQAELRELEKTAAEKKDALKKATKVLDEHPHFEKVSYSRSCAICLKENPRQRMVLVPCGHIVCSSCPENLEKPVMCPLCRKATASFVRLFEDEEP